MTTYIALLRGINVGGQKMVPMAGLRALATQLGYLHPRTLLQSGNLVFAAEAKDQAEIAERLEGEILAHFKLEVHVIVRSQKEWLQIIAENPFAAESEADPSHLIVMPVKEAVAAPRLKALREMIRGREVVEQIGRTLFVVFPDGIGNSRLAGQLTDRNLGTVGTGRNWNTVQKIAALAAEKP